MTGCKPAVQEAPLLKQLLSSSSPEQAAERLWLVRLLAAGFQDQTEGDIFRCALACCELCITIHPLTINEIKTIGDKQAADATLQA